MINGLVDHWWQSCCCGGVACAFSMLTRGNAAVVRLWLWRIATAKLLVPFSALCAVGAWMGFPVAHSSLPVPPALVATIDAIAPWVSPARFFGIDGSFAMICCLAGLVATGAMGWWMLGQLREERTLALAEGRQREAAVDDLPPSMGFTRAALFTATALVLIVGPMLAGAVSDREWRRELLIENSRLLRDARLTLKDAAPGMGERARIFADARGVLVRNASVRDLVALAYGVNRYSVWANQMYEMRDDGHIDSWLLAPRYDVRAEAPIHVPAQFDPYALRRPISRLLADRFSIEIYVNGSCQPPCGVYKMEVGTEPL